MTISKQQHLNSINKNINNNNSILAYPTFGTFLRTSITLSLTSFYSDPSNE